MRDQRIVERQSADFGHEYVGDDRVESGAAGHNGERFRGRTRFEDPKTAALEKASERTADRLFVVDYEHGGHAS